MTTPTEQISFSNCPTCGHFPTQIIEGAVTEYRAHALGEGEAFYCRHNKGSDPGCAKWCGSCPLHGQRQHPAEVVEALRVAVLVLRDIRLTDFWHITDSTKDPGKYADAIHEHFLEDQTP